ncbi:sulfatase-like hydrolase/transferase [Coraliomargarita sp. SDUM461003]|uniref:Sulfatase-like hydrolase/transferase n=1 Tax=Thalassobacterium maritimum TaxID=3041265 RepID=A0ABU1AZR2_9BACT|nr:sulfatase-like hydrolase/transferase [Coraliomargarita sp. SDUM461003]MDQ8209639.1 sulfatase-like hydrolase/transferase [Coraliomargarita sp. SDUM461003]
MKIPLNMPRYFLLLIPALVATLAMAAPTKPNIVYIVIDNVEFEHMGKAYGGDKVTPAMDSIAEDGALMQRMYVPTPLCIPSRYSILAGRYPERCTEEDYLKEYPKGDETWGVDVALETDLPNLPKTLQTAGYTTAFVGKFHNSRNKDLVIRSELNGKHITDPEVTPVLEKYNDRLIQHIQSCGFDWVGAAGFGNGLVGSANGVDTDDVHHNLEWEIDHALQFLKQQQEQDSPFFLYLSTKLFHLPVNTEEDFLSDYSKVGRYTERGLLEKAPEVPMPSRKEIVEIARKDSGDERDAIAMRVLDFGIQAVLDQVEAMGIDDNTIIVFISDNAQMGKSTVYEGGIRVPSAIKWPKVIQPGTQLTEIVSTLDIATTLIDVAGATPPAEMKADGHSFLPVLEKGAAAEWKNVFMAEYNCAKAIVTPRWKYVAVRYTEDQWQKIREEEARQPSAPDFNNENRMRKWKKWTQPELSENQLPYAFNIYRYWTQHDMNHIKRAGQYPYIFDLDQLYDLENDPNEQKNLAKDPAYAEQLDQMKALMHREVAKMDRPFGEFGTINQ